MKRFSKEQGYGRFLSRYLGFLSRHTGVILVVYMVVMGFFIYQASFIKLDSNLYSLFPQKMKSLQYLQKMQTYYGGVGALRLSVQIPHQDQMLSALLPKYIDENDQEYIRDLENIQKNMQDPDPVTSTDLATVDRDVKEYFQKMDQYYLPAFHREIESNPNRKYTQLFLKEYEELIKPDVETKYQALRNAPTKSNLTALLESFRDNVSGANLYLEKIGESLPADREVFLEDFISRFARALNNDPSIVFVDYMFNQKFVEDHLLYFLDTSDIQYIQTQLQDRIDYERRKSLLSSFLLVDQNDSDLKFKYLRDKYIRSRGTGVSRKFIRLQNPDQVFDGKNNGKTQQFYLSEAKDAGVLNVRVSRGAIDINYSLKILDLVDRIFHRVQKENSRFKNLQLTPTGQYVDRKEDARVLRQDMARVTPVAFFLVCLVIMIYFRNPLAILIVCFPLFSDMLAALGFVRVTYGHLNLVSSFLIAIISGLGVNLGTHLLSRYLEAKNKGKPPLEALYEVFTTIFLSNITATLTTAAGFFVLALSSFKGFREFGVIAGVGMISLLFGIILTFPTLILWLESHKLFRLRMRRGKFFENLRGKQFPLFKFWCLFGFFWVILSLFFIRDINFNANFTSLVKKSNSTPSFSDYYGTSALQILKLSNSSGMIPIYTPNRKLYQELNDQFLTSRFANENFRIESLYIYDPSDQSKKQKAMRELHKTLQSGLLNANDDDDIQARIDFLKRIVKTPPTTWDSIPDSLRGSFLGVKPGYFLLYYPMESPKSVYVINKYYNDFERIEQEYKDQGVFLASDIWIFGELIRVLEKEGLIIFLGILLTFVLLLWFDFHSIVLVIAALTPLVVGFICMAGACIFFHIEWNFFNVLMFPVIAGLGIDYGVHMLHRIREEGNHNLLFVFSMTGRTMWVAAFQDMLGFGSLIVALYYGLVTTGQILIVGVLSCLISGSIFLPSIIQWREDIRTKGWKKSLFSLNGLVPSFFLKKPHKSLPFLGKEDNS